MDPYRPRSNRTILWTVTDSHDSNGFLVSSLKMALFHLFFFFPIRRHLEHTHWTKFNPETVKPSPHSGALCLYLTLSITSLVFASLPHHRRNSAQIVAHSLNHSLPLSLVAVAAHSLPRRRRSSLSASSPSLLLHRILAQIAKYFIRFNSSFFYVNLYFLSNFWRKSSLFF